MKILLPMWLLILMIGSLLVAYGDSYIIVGGDGEFDYSELHPYLEDITLLAPDDSYFIVGNGTDWIRETGNTARTSLGLGTGDTPSFAKIGINRPSPSYELELWHNIDSNGYLYLRSGLTADQRMYLMWNNYLGSQRWLMGRNASNYFILFDSLDALHRFRLYPDGSTELSSGGFWPVRINYADDNSGTGGLEVYSGGAVPALQHRLDTTGLEIFNGTLTLHGTATLGAASTDLITCTGRWIPRTVAADPTANATAGSLGEIVFFGDKWYGKTVADGTDVNWSALN